MTAGLIVAAAVLLIGTAAGLWHRRADGRLRPATPHPPATRQPAAATGQPAEAAAVPAAPAAAATAAVPAAAAPAVAAEPAESGSPSTYPGLGKADELPLSAVDAVLLAELGAGAPAAATLLQFSSAFCAPCRAVRRISGEVAAMIPGVRHVEVDAESHLDAVRTLKIWRTPTLLVLDAQGREVRRATGVPSKPQLIAALGAVIGEQT